MDRERKRVCYIRSVPEWFGHTVNDMFFREAQWLFCPVQDLAPAQRSAAYRRATYFFVSGFGHGEEASRARTEGCMVVGVRADVDRRLLMVECPAWDPVGVFVTLKLIEDLRLHRLLGDRALPPWAERFVYRLVSVLVSWRFIWQWKYRIGRAIQIYREEGFKALLFKTRNYVYKAWGIRSKMLTRW